MAVDVGTGNELLAAALAYAARGWRVFPLHTPTPGGKWPCSCNGTNAGCRTADGGNVGKHPRTTNGLKDATTDAAQIHAWWSMWPAANVGLATGAGLVVLDIDPEKGGRDTLSDLVGAHGALPETVQAITGSGGDHYYLATDLPLRNTAGTLGPGVDTRGEGGYVVAPPSLHRSGRRYVWEASGDPEEVAVGALPAAWAARLTRRPQAVRTPEDENEPIGEGQRNDRLYRLGCSLRAKGLSQRAIEAALLVVNEGQCRPPLDPREVQTLAASVAQRPPGWSPEVRAEVEAREALRERDERVRVGGVEDEGAAPARAPDVFIRGDAPELARALLLDLRGDSPAEVVYDRGRFWRYDAHGGLWAEVPLSEPFRLVGDYASTRRVIGRKGPAPLKLSGAAIEGAVKMAGRYADSPGFFDDAPAGVAFEDVFVHVEGGRVLRAPHAPEHRAVAGLPYPYDEGATAPRWGEYLEEVFALASEEDRAARVMLLQEHAGACLAGLATAYRVALVLTGDGLNGKSVYLDVLRALFPREQVSSISPQQWANGFFLAELAGKRLNAVAELPDGPILASETFKAVLTGDAMTVARKREHPFMMRAKAGHVFACNALPATKDQSEGFWSRVEAVAFDRVFTREERDTRLTEKLLRELPGVAVWALDGAARLQRKGGYTTPASSAEVKAEWQMDADIVRQFIAECTADLAKGDEGTTGTAMFEAFVWWAKNAGHQGMGRGRFWRRLGKLVGAAESNGTARFYPRRLLPGARPPGMSMYR